MPFDTVGGLPPMPKHARGATLYHPRQPRVHMSARGPALRGTVVEAAATSPLPYLVTDSSGGCAGDGVYSSGMLPALPSGASLPKVLVPFATNDVTWPNPWWQETRLEDLEAQQRGGPCGVAQFRPALKGAQDYASGASDQSKPLLEVYHSAQELAQVASEDTWHLRRNRYLQWLRHAAVAALDAQRCGARPSCEPVYFSTTMSEQAVASPDLGSADAAQAGTFSTETPSLPRVAPPPRGASPETSRECDVNHTRAGVPLRQKVGSVSGALPSLSGTNANELAVQCLFRAARMATAPSAAGGTATEPPCSPPAGELEPSSPEQSVRHGSRRRSLLSPIGETAGSPESSGVEALVRDQIDAGSAEADADAPAQVAAASAAARVSAEGAMTELLVNRAGLTAFVCGNTESGDLDEEYSSTSNYATVPPPEYDLGGLLLDRMHRTVAAFTSSSRHTLDKPPVAAKTHTFLGKARLCNNATAPAQFVEAAISEAHPCAASGGKASLAQPTSAASQDLVRVLQRLLYEEEYERGVLYQLALQSSPTRWYSALLPGGEEGIRFRLIAPPQMFGDEEIRERLRSATLRAAESIAQPRRDAAAADEDRRRATGRAWDTDRADEAQCADRWVRSMVECAAAEKAHMFTEWACLYVNLSAQLQLITEEMQQRRGLLGEFLSCTYPSPCACVNLDLEVLALSAVQLEPTVKPACWYASVVLGRHRDVLQRDLLESFTAERDGLYNRFKVVFCALYCYKKLAAEEARCFGRMLHYHDFCLRMTASRMHERVLPRSEDSPPGDSVAPRESPSHSAACSGRGALQRVHPESVWLALTDERVVCRSDARMWRLRQRRLRYCAGNDSPLFSYLVYIDLLSAAAAEEKVRSMIVDAEAVEHMGLRMHMIAEGAFARLYDSEQRCRAQIRVDEDEAHDAICAGPLAEMREVHLAEVLSVQTGAYAETLEDVLQGFVASVVEQKTAVATEEMRRYQVIVREAWSRLLLLLVKKRSAAESAATAREWLDRQQHVPLFKSEQRLRDGIVLYEEADAYARIAEAFEASLRKARKLEAFRLSKETAAARETAQGTRGASGPCGRAQLRQGERSAGARKRTGANKRTNAVDLMPLARALEDDFEAFLSSTQVDL